MFNIICVYLGGSYLWVHVHFGGAEHRQIRRHHSSHEIFGQLYVQDQDKF